MAEDSIHHPNDKLLKATFSVPENARGFFRNHLPQNLAKIIDWDSLTLEPSTFIDPQFASSESDFWISYGFHCSKAKTHPNLNSSIAWEPFSWRR